MQSSSVKKQKTSTTNFLANLIPLNSLSGSSRTSTSLNPKNLTYSKSIKKLKQDDFPISSQLTTYHQQPMLLSGDGVLNSAIVSSKPSSMSASETKTTLKIHKRKTTIQNEAVALSQEDTSQQKQQQYRESIQIEQTTSLNTPQTIFLDDSIQDPDDLNRKIKESVEKYMKQKIPSSGQQPTSRGASQGLRKHQTAAPIIQQDPISKNNNQGKPQAVATQPQNQAVYQHIIDSFTHKIETLQHVISEQKLIIEQKDKELMKLKLKNASFMGQEMRASGNGFESVMQSRNEEGLRKYFNKNIFEEMEGRCKALESRKLELEAKVDIMQEEIYRLKHPSMSTASIQCKLISSRTLDELSKMQFELDQERQTVTVLKRQITQKGEQALQSNDRRNEQLFSAIQSLKGELDYEKLQIETESYKEIANQAKLETESLRQQLAQLQYDHQAQLQKVRDEFAKPYSKHQYIDCQIMKYSEVIQMKHSLEEGGKAQVQLHEKITKLKSEIGQKEHEIMESNAKIVVLSSDIENLRKDLKHKNIETDTNFSKSILLQAGLDAKELQISSLHQELQAKEKLHEVLLQAERSQQEIKLNQERAHFNHQIEEERYSLLKQRDAQVSELRSQLERHLNRDVKEVSIVTELKKTREVYTGTEVLQHLNAEAQSESPIYDEVGAQCEVPRYSEAEAQYDLAFHEQAATQCELPQYAEAEAQYEYEQVSEQVQELSFEYQNPPDDIQEQQLLLIDQEDAFVSCELLNPRDFQTLRARLEDLSKELQDQTLQIEVLENQAALKDQDLLQKSKQLKDQEELLTLTSDQQRELERLRALNSQFMQENELLLSDLNSYREKQEAKSYIQSMLKKQNENSLQKTFDDEMHQLKLQFELERQKLVSFYESVVPIEQSEKEIQCSDSQFELKIEEYERMFGELRAAQDAQREETNEIINRKDEKLEEYQLNYKLVKEELDSEKIKIVQIIEEKELLQIQIEQIKEIQYVKNVVQDAFTQHAEEIFEEEFTDEACAIQEDTEIDLKGSSSFKLIDESKVQELQSSYEKMLQDLRVKFKAELEEANEIIKRKDEQLEELERNYQFAKDEHDNIFGSEITQEKELVQSQIEEVAVDTVQNAITQDDPIVKSDQVVERLIKEQSKVQQLENTLQEQEWQLSQKQQEIEQVQTQIENQSLELAQKSERLEQLEVQIVEKALEMESLQTLNAQLSLEKENLQNDLQLLKQIEFNSDEIIPQDQIQQEEELQEEQIYIEDQEEKWENQEEAANDLQEIQEYCEIQETREQSLMCEILYDQEPELYALTEALKTSEAALFSSQNTCQHLEQRITSLTYKLVQQTQQQKELKTEILAKNEEIQELFSRFDAKNYIQKLFSSELYNVYNAEKLMIEVSEESLAQARFLIANLESEKHRVLGEVEDLRRKIQETEFNETALRMLNEENREIVQQLQIRTEEYAALQQKLEELTLVPDLPSKDYPLLQEKLLAPSGTHTPEQATPRAHVSFSISRDLFHIDQHNDLLQQIESLTQELQLSQYNNLELQKSIDTLQQQISDYENLIDDDRPEVQSQEVQTSIDYQEAELECKIESEDMQKQAELKQEQFDEVKHNYESQLERIIMINSELQSQIDLLKLNEIEYTSQLQQNQFQQSESTSKIEELTAQISALETQLHVNPHDTLVENYTQTTLLDTNELSLECDLISQTLVDSLIDKNQELQYQVLQTNKEAKSMADQLVKLKQSYTALIEEHALLQDQMETAKETRDIEVQSQLFSEEDFIGQVASKNQEVEEMRQKLEMQQEEIFTLNEKLSQCEERLNVEKLDQEIGCDILTYEVIESKILQAANALKLAQDQIKESNEQQLEQLQTSTNEQIQALQSEIASLAANHEQEIYELNSQISLLQGIIHDKDKQIEELQSSNYDQAAQIDQLAPVQQQLEEYLSKEHKDQDIQCELIDTYVLEERLNEYKELLQLKEQELSNLNQQIQETNQKQDIELTCDILDSEIIAQLNSQLAQSAQNEQDLKMQAQEQVQEALDTVIKEYDEKLISLQAKESQARESLLEEERKKAIEAQEVLQQEIKRVLTQQEQMAQEMKIKDQRIEELIQNKNASQVTVVQESSPQVQGLTQALELQEQEITKKNKTIEMLKDQLQKMLETQGAQVIQRVPSQPQIITPPPVIEEETYVFCYGSNHPLSLAKLLNISVQDILSKSISANLVGYGRVFVGMSPNYGNGSIANIIQHEKSEVEGYAVKLKPDQIQKLEKSIGFPDLYNKLKIKMKKLPFKEGDQLLSGEVYIIIDATFIEMYKKPSADYLNAVVKTLSASLFLRNGPFEEKKHEIKLKVFNGAEVTLDFIHNAYASMDFFIPQEQASPQQAKPAQKKAATKSHLLF